MNTILITGGSGLIGRYLSDRLEKIGYTIRILSRQNKEDDRFSYYRWNIKESYIDPAALDNVDVIIHLSGAGIADKRWTKKRKAEIIESRTKGAQLLLNQLKKRNQKLKAFISASGIGYYGAVTNDHKYIESDPPSEDFIGETCRLWEEEASNFVDIAERIIKVRTGLVLARDGGFLSRLAPFLRLNLLSSLGSGKQFMPWIHIEDLVSIYIYCLEKEGIKGAINAVSEEDINNKDFTNTLVKSYNKKVILPAVPAFALKIVLGEMSSILLEGSKVSPQLIIDKGFRFQFKKLELALTSLQNNA